MCQPDQCGMPMILRRFVVASMRFAADYSFLQNYKTDPDLLTDHENDHKTDHPGWEENLKIIVIFSSFSFVLKFSAPTSFYTAARAYDISEFPIVYACRYSKICNRGI